MNKRFDSTERKDNDKRAVLESDCKLCRKTIDIFQAHRSRGRWFASTGNDRDVASGVSRLNLMTIVEMIDEIDRLITSSEPISRIKPLLVSLREQAEAIEARVRTLESKSKVKRLEGEKNLLRTELDTALKQIQELENKQQLTHKSDRAQVGIRILYAVSRAEGITTATLAEGMKMGEQRIQFHLDELLQGEFITCVIRPSGRGVLGPRTQRKIETLRPRIAEIIFGSIRPTAVHQIQKPSVKFRNVMRQILSVDKRELDRREAEYKKQRKIKSHR